MATAQDVLDLILFDMWEDAGLQLGVLTEAQFLDFLNECLVDFTSQTCCSQIIQTQSVFAGTGRFIYPDEMLRVDNAFLGGVYLEPATVQSLNIDLRRWRTELGEPRRYHTDELPLKTLEIAPLPQISGVFAPGPNEPDPPHAQTGSFSILDSLGATIPPNVHGDLTTVGPQGAKAVAALGDTLQYSDGSYIPDDFVTAYIGYGVLHRIFSGDNELRNLGVADFCRSMYEEGISILQAFTNEPSLES